MTRQDLIKLATENPEMRQHLVPILRASKEANWKDTLENLWHSYKEDHPHAEKPPQSLVDKAKGDGGDKSKHKYKDPMFRVPRGQVNKESAQRVASRYLEN
jgi:hypothetical protein